MSGRDDRGRRSPWSTPERHEGVPEAPHRRAPVEIGQLTVRGDAEVLERFRRHCRDDRRTNVDMLRMLLDASTIWEIETDRDVTEPALILADVILLVVDTDRRQRKPRPGTPTALPVAGDDNR